MAESLPQPVAPADRRAERRLTIISTAARLIARKGYADCEMELVANEIGIAKGTLYLYFKSKEELFYACVDQGMHELQAAVQSAAALHAEPFSRISAAILAYLLFFEQHPEQVELLIQERAVFRDRPTPTYFTHREAMRERWRLVWSGLIDEGKIRPDLKAEQILDFVGNLVYGTMFTNHFLGRSATEQHAAIVDIVYLGIWSESQRMASGGHQPTEPLKSLGNENSVG
jgi:AcrR family transcriptional regulator